MIKHQWTVSGRLWVSSYGVREPASQKLTGKVDMMQEIANDINKMKRSSLIHPLLWSCGAKASRR